MNPFTLYWAGKIPASVFPSSDPTGLDDVVRLRKAAIPIWYKWAKKDADATRVFKLHLDYMTNEILGCVTPEDIKGQSL